MGRNLECVLEVALTNASSGGDTLRQHEGNASQLLEFLAGRGGVGFRKIAWDHDDWLDVGSPFDVQAIVKGTAPLVTLAMTLWSTYRHFVEPGGARWAALMVRVENRHQSILFGLGQDYTDELIFVRDFCDSVEALMMPETTESHSEALSRQSDFGTTSTAAVVSMPEKG